MQITMQTLTLQQRKVYLSVASGTGSLGKSADTFFLTPGAAAGAAPTLSGTDTSGEVQAIDLSLVTIQDPTDDSIDMVVVEMNDAFFGDLDDKVVNVLDEILSTLRKIELKLADDIQGGEV